MTTIDDLRAVLDDQADDVTGTAGLFAYAEAGAAKVRRRRRITTAVVAAVAVLVAGALIPLVAGRDQGQRRLTPPVPAASRAATYRTAWQSTVGIDSGAGYPVDFVKLDANRQTISAYREVAAGQQTPANSGGTVSVFDPGTFHPAQFAGPRRITVAGHLAWFQQAYRMPVNPSGGVTITTPVIGWTGPAGEWVLVYDLGVGTVDEAALTRFAGAVQLGAPRPLLLPVHIGWVPPRMVPTGAEVDYRQRYGGSVSFADHPRSSDVSAMQIPPPDDIGLEVKAEAKGASWTDIEGSLTGPFTLQGRPAWYRTGQLVVDLGSCVLWIEHPIGPAWSRADLTRVATTARVGHCDSPSSWDPPFG